MWKEKHYIYERYYTEKHNIEEAHYEEAYEQQTDTKRPEGEMSVTTPVLQTRERKCGQDLKRDTKI